MEAKGVFSQALKAVGFNRFKKVAAECYAAEYVHYPLSIIPAYAKSTGGWALSIIHYFNHLIKMIFFESTNRAVSIRHR